ncbi:hypothetical protein USDA257_c14110 [Sinorhizobium fredii USDA 257]|uniref:Uncharacterized protein n=1 Tax=Sinorhizobium fredii (strain USDA 257) TaxID=1185652 RepID=I3X295_SINF2|nr:hypothetical protein USDA257_c14110 [Sinorhizobium fredii USDA 257]
MSEELFNEQKRDHRYHSGRDCHPRGNFPDAGWHRTDSRNAPGAGPNRTRACACGTRTRTRNARARDTGTHYSGAYYAHAYYAHAYYARAYYARAIDRRATVLEASRPLGRECLFLCLICQRTRELRLRRRCRRERCYAAICQSVTAWMPSIWTVSAGRSVSTG